MSNTTPVAAPSRRAKISAPVAPVATAHVQLSEEQKKARNAARMRQIRHGWDSATATQQALDHVLNGTPLPEIGGAPAKASRKAAPVVAPSVPAKRTRTVAAPVAAPAAPARRAAKSAIPTPPTGAVAPSAPARRTRSADVGTASKVEAGIEAVFVFTDLRTMKLYHAADVAGLQQIVKSLR